MPRRALRAGARGYVMKQEPGERSGDGYPRSAERKCLPEQTRYRRRLLNRVATGNTEPEPFINSLSPSEFEVLHLIEPDTVARQIAQLA